MTILIAGGSGFIGSYLVPALVARGDSVVVLTRDARRVESGSGTPVRAVQWNGATAGAWCDELSTADAVINLTGLSLNSGRWTAKRKRALIDSRIAPTRALVEAMTASPRKPSVFVSASGIGYYGNVPEGALREEASGLAEPAQALLQLVRVPAPPARPSAAAAMQYHCWRAPGLLSATYPAPAYRQPSCHCRRQMIARAPSPETCERDSSRVSFSCEPLNAKAPRRGFPPRGAELFG